MSVNNDSIKRNQEYLGAVSWTDRAGRVEEEALRGYGGEQGLLPSARKRETVAGRKGVWWEPCSLTHILLLSSCILSLLQVSHTHTHISTFVCICVHRHARTPKGT